MISYEFYTPYGDLFKKGKVKTKKSLRRVKEKANLTYGAHLSCVAVDDKGEKVFIYN